MEILKEEEGDILGDGNFSEFQNGDYPKRRFPISFIGNGDFENIRILKEGRGFNLGDGKFSGIPKFEMMASLGKLGTLGNSDARGKFRTTRRMKSQNRKWRQTGVFYLLKTSTFLVRPHYNVCLSAPNDVGAGVDSVA